MAKVILEPIGDARQRLLADDTWESQKAKAEQLGRDLDDKRATVRAGWGPTYEARVREKGKIPTWERIERLRDSDSPAAGWW